MQSNNETEDIPGGKQMKTKQITEEITIRKTMMYKRGAEMIKALENCPKEELLPLPIIPAFNDELGKWEFFAEEQKKENGIGMLEKGDMDLLEHLSDPDVSYKIQLKSCENNLFHAVIEVTEKEMVTPVEVKDSDTLEEIKKKIIKKGICSKEDLKRNIDVMKAHRCPEELIRQILLRYRKFEKSISVPKTFYIDPDPKSKDASIFALALLNTLTNSATIFEGDKSVGKNVCAETLAMCLNMPYYMITFNRGMTADDIYGTKSTDNSAAELLTEELADAYLQVAAGNREIPATVEKAAKYEYLRAKASPVSIVQEESCLVEWIKNGGVMCFNEMNMAEANFFASFTNQLTDNTGFIDIPGYGHLEINPDCILIGTQNADYTGVCEQNDATMSRFGCIQFPYPKSIKAQLEATVGKDRLDKAYFKQTDELYKTLYAAVTKGMVENSCLNIRGFIRGLKGVAQVPGLSTLKRQIEIHVIDTCPVDDRLQLMQLVREKITL